ncbi:hypothetical protein HHK36_003553 [Tetracentron sinense]|uniref:Protein FAR1-RELATED SEQUENCE n=1 Tax=Tetracentron sinense TaxID=13715 RepID=A0A834ZNF7_TETSI|nr:hypothetical protein HHK36_003553 [Tetracentron sinense]
MEQFPIDILKTYDQIDGNNDEVLGCFADNVGYNGHFETSVETEKVLQEGDCFIESKVGMTFDSIENAKNYYKEYARLNGFRTHVSSRLDVLEIPPHFILKRWIKDANKGEVIDDVGSQIHDGYSGAEVLRVSQACQQATELAYMAGRSKAMFTRVMYHFDQAYEELLIIENDLLQKENGDDIQKDSHINNEKTTQ